MAWEAAFPAVARPEAISAVAVRLASASSNSAINATPGVWKKGGVTSRMRQTKKFWDFQVVKTLFSFPWDAGTWLQRLPSVISSDVGSRSDFRYLMTGTFPFNFLISHGDIDAGTGAFVAFEAFLGYWSSDLGPSSQELSQDCGLCLCKLSRLWLEMQFFEFFFGLVKSGPEDEKMMNNKCPWIFRDHPAKAFVFYRVLARPAKFILSLDEFCRNPNFKLRDSWQSLISLFSSTVDHWSIAVRYVCMHVYT